MAEMLKTEDGMTLKEDVPFDIQIPHAPEIPGLRFRRLSDAADGQRADFVQLAEVLNTGRQADGIEQVETAESIESEVGESPKPLMAEVDGVVIGWSRIVWLPMDDDGSILYMMGGHIRPEWRHKGIGRAMLRFNEMELREAAGAHPVETPKAFGSFAWESEKERTRLLLSEGYHSETNEVFMVRPDLESLPEVVLRNGIEIRPVQPEHMRAIFEADNEAMADDSLHSPQDEEDYKRFLTHPMSRPDLWAVAWEGDQVVGQVRSFINEAENAQYRRKRGYTEDISVRRPWRRKGIAKALIAHSFRTLKAEGMEEAALGTDEDNPRNTVNLYESMGFRIVARSHYYRKAWA
jgi:mycothiol synthase